MAGPNQRQKFTRQEKAEQARVCWQMALDGYSQAVIAQTVGISQPTVSRRMGAYESQIVIPEAEHWRKKQIERTEDLINALRPFIAPGALELPAVQHYLKALAQLDTYTGAALPTRIESTVTIQDAKDAELAEMIALVEAQDALAHDDKQPDPIQTDVQTSDSETNV